MSQSPVQTVQPLLVNDDTAAAMLGMSESFFSKFAKSSEFGPRPYRFGATGKLKVWRVSDLERWVAMGLCDRETWLKSMTSTKPSENATEGSDSTQIDRQAVNQGSFE